MNRENYEKLREAIKLLTGHHGTLAWTLGRDGKWMRENLDLDMAMELLMEIKSSEQKREQDEHAIAFAKAGEEE